MIGPRQVVLPVPATPPRYGLVVSARPVDEPDERWTNGFTWNPETCYESGVGDPCTQGGNKVIGSNPPIREFDPFFVWAGDKCSPFQERDWMGRATRQLLATESKQIEHEFWTGEQAQASGWPNAYLTDGNAVHVTSGAVSVLQALECLEQALSFCAAGSRGMIHAPPHVVVAWTNLQVLRREGNLILTYLDTIVVPGSGYDGSGPDGTPESSGHVWAYATGIVDVRRSTVRVVPENGNLREALDRDSNLVEVRAERFAAATWDGCCQFAAETNLATCTTGS